MSNLQASTLRTGDGAYSVAASTPTASPITTIAAGTATAGHIWAARWSPATTQGPQFAVLTRFRARWVTVLGFTGAQETSMDLMQARAYTASHTGGNAVTLTTNNGKKRTNPFPTTAFADMRIAGAAALTAGTHVLDAQPVAQASYSELAAAATVPKGQMEIFLSTEDLDRYPIVLARDEGLILRNVVLMGAGGTARLIVEMNWLEVKRY